VKVVLFGRRGKVGSVLAPALEAAGHELVESTQEAEIAVDFTRPEAVEENVRVALEDGVPVVVGTTGFDEERVAALARVHELPVFYAPNFALGAVLAMQFAEQAAQLFPHVEIVELHSEHKLDAPSGTAEATAERIRAVTGHAVPIHSVRLPGLVAHQEVIFGGPGQTLSIRHDSIDRESFMPGVLLAVRKVGSLERSPTVGLENIL
jgi:4-hydroxy-tetrahydrodipicolinate reductase